MAEIGRENGLHIAVVPSYGLGDGLLWLILAENLRRNGLRVTFFHDYIYQIKDWLPNIEVKPFPVINGNLDEEFRIHDLIIAEAVSVISDNKPSITCPMSLAKCVFVGMSRFYYDSFCKPARYISQNVKEKKNLTQLLRIAQSNGTIISRLSKANTMADNVVQFCKEVIHLKNVDKSDGIVPPGNLQHRKVKRRVIIHPTSAKEEKNWLPIQFKKLALYLKKHGWSPAFTVSPEEYHQWKTIVDGDFHIPFLASVNDLAKYIYESQYMIGNDSGTGHLASSLGIPTVTIYKKRSGTLRWRPGMYFGSVVTPDISLKINGKRYWRRFLSVKKVTSAFEKLTEDVRNWEQSKMT